MRRTELLLRLLPLLLPFAAVFGCGLTITLLQSFGLLMFSYSYDDLFFAYRELFADSWFLRSAAFSLYVAFASSSLSIVLGTVLAYAVWRLPARRRQLTIIYKIPLVLPHIAVGFLAVLFLAKTGIVSAVAYRLGLIESFESFPGAALYPLGHRPDIGLCLQGDAVCDGHGLRHARQVRPAADRHRQDARFRDAADIFLAHPALCHAGDQYHLHHPLHLHLRRLRPAFRPRRQLSRHAEHPGLRLFLPEGYRPAAGGHGHADPDFRLLAGLHRRLSPPVGETCREVRKL